MSALAGLLGAGCGLGLVLVILGLRGVETSQLRRREKRSPRLERLSLRLALGVGAAVLIGASTGWPVGALLAGLGGFAAPGLASGKKAAEAAITRAEAVASWTEMLRDTIAAAAGLEQAIIATAAVAPEPLRPAVGRLAGSLQAGERLAVALAAFSDELVDPTADLVTAALLMAAGHPVRRLGELLSTLAQAARDQAGMALRVEAGRARTRTSVRIVVGATASLVVGLALLNRGFLAPYDSALGQLVLLVIGACFAGSFWWLARISAPQAPKRVLAGLGSGRGSS